MSEKELDKPKIKQNYLSPRWSGEVCDCSMPVALDTYNTCSYNCLYCFAFFQKSHTDISKKRSKTTKFTAKLLNSKGKILKSKTVTFKFKGKNYKRKTNGKGIATLSLKYLKVGKYAIYSTYGKLTVKNIIKLTK